jgi:hypothetical protein
MLLPNVVFQEMLFLHTIDVHVVTCCFLSVSSLLYNKLTELWTFVASCFISQHNGNALQASNLK